MKKILCVLLAAALLMTAFAGCGEKKTETPAEEPAAETKQAESEVPAAEEETTTVANPMKESSAEEIKNLFDV